MKPNKKSTVIPVHPIAPAITVPPISPLPDEKTWKKIELMTVLSGIKYLSGVTLDITSGNMAKQFKKANKFKRWSAKRKQQLRAYRNARIKKQFSNVFADFLDICAKEKVVVSEQVAKEIRHDIKKTPIPDMYIKIPNNLK